MSGIELGQPSVTSLPSLLPGAWDLTGLEIEVSVELGPCCGVNAGFYEAYEAGNLDEAVTKLAHSGGAIHYRVFGKEPFVHYTWDATRPLSGKRGRREVRERGPIQGAAPWDWFVDDTAFEIFRDREGVVRLRAGGVSADDAVANWRLLAGHLRPLFRSRCAELEDAS